MNVRRVVLCVVIAIVPVVARATFDPAAMRQKYVVGATYHTMGFTGSEARDVDGVAGDEVLIGYTNMWQLLRWDNKSADFAQVGFYENDYGGIFGGGGLTSVHFARSSRSRRAGPGFSRCSPTTVRSADSISTAPCALLSGSRPRRTWS